MRYAVSHISVIGPIWQPGMVCAMDYRLSSHDIENMRSDDGTISRDDVENWIGCHSGDFQSVTDFSACIEDGEATLDFPWTTDESEMTYADYMYEED